MPGTACSNTKAVYQGPLFVSLTLFSDMNDDEAINGSQVHACACFWLSTAPPLAISAGGSSSPSPAHPRALFIPCLHVSCEYYFCCARVHTQAYLRQARLPVSERFLCPVDAAHEVL